MFRLFSLAINYKIRLLDVHSRGNEYGMEQKASSELLGTWMKMARDRGLMDARGQ